MVLVWHYIAVPAEKEFQLGSSGAYLLATLRMTWSGVDLFFVLSGFLIGRILLDSRSSPRYYSAFYGRRAARIFPLYGLWLTLFFVALSFVGWRPTQPLREIANTDLPVWSYALFLQNFAMYARQTFGPAWLGVTWSLAVEEQFYLLLPVLVRKLRTSAMLSVTIAVVVLAPLVRVMLSGSGFGPYVLLPSRADALGCGVLLAYAARTPAVWSWLVGHRRAVAAALVAFAVGFAAVFKYPALKFGVGLSWIAGFYALLLLHVILSPEGRLGAILRSRALVLMGTLAYPVYLIHQTVNAVVHAALFGAVPRLHDLVTLGATALSFALVMLIASASWRFIEEPIIRLAHLRFRY